MKTMWNQGFLPAAATLGYGRMMGGWRDYVDKYNEVFRPETEPKDAPAPSALPASAAAKPTTFLGIPQNVLLWGGVAALAAGVGLVAWKKLK
jgi:hypothetical protein